MPFVNLEFDNKIATLTLDHPNGNRINFPMRAEILCAIEEVSKSDSRVLVIRAKGADFCLGGDIRDWPGVPSADLRPKLEVYAHAIDLLEALSIPTIAAVQGGCMGGGFELVLGCDVVVATQSSRFMFPEALLGIMTLQGGVYRFAQRVGRSKALEMVFLPEPLDAKQMSDWNVVNRVVEDRDLDGAVQRIAERLRYGPADAYKRTKELMRVWGTEGNAAARAALYNISMPLFDTDAVQSVLRDAADAVNSGKPIAKTTF